jgi:hypothetical protein
LCTIKSKKRYTTLLRINRCYTRGRCVSQKCDCDTQQYPGYHFFPVVVIPMTE